MSSVALIWPAVVEAAVPTPTELNWGSPVVPSLAEAKVPAEIVEALFKFTFADSLASAKVPAEIVEALLRVTLADNLASATAVLKIQNSNVICPVLPTSSVGLPSGALWKNGNVINVV